MPGRRGYIHLLLHDLLVRQHNPHALRARVHAALYGLIEARFPGSNLVGTTLAWNKAAATREIAPQGKRAFTRLDHGHLGPCNRLAVLVHNCYANFGRQVQSRSAGLHLPARNNCAEANKQAA